MRKQELKFPRFLCFSCFWFVLFFFPPFLSYTLLAQTQNKKLSETKVTMTEKIKFPRFLSFRFWPVPEIENLKISESFRLLQVLII